MGLSRCGFIRTIPELLQLSLAGFLFNCSQFLTDLPVLSFDVSIHYHIVVLLFKKFLEEYLEVREHAEMR